MCSSDLHARYIAIKFSVRGRDLAGAVQDAQAQTAAGIKFPPGYRAVWGGEYEEYTSSRSQLRIVLPVTFGLIFVLLFGLYQNVKFPVITVLGVILSDPIGEKAHTRRPSRRPSLMKNGYVAKIAPAVACSGHRASPVSEAVFTPKTPLFHMKSRPFCARKGRHSTPRPGTFW